MQSPANLKPLAAPIPVRRAEPADLDALVALEQVSFRGDRMSRAQFQRHLRSDSALLLVAGTSRESLLGSALLLFRRGSSLARLYSIARRADARGCGVGAALFNAVENAAQSRGCCRLRLEVRQDNAVARRLYQRLGYSVIAELPGYYEDGGDGLRYEKALAESV